MELKKDILPELNGKEYIQELSQEYEIRFCKEEEVSELMDFLKKYWKNDHIFVLSKELLDFQHFDKKNHRYNFVIAKYKKTQEIHSILGFVPTSHFDQAIKKTMVWPCIWKSREDISRKGLGVSLYYYLKITLEIDTISILGISEVALSIYKHWNFKTGKMEQYFLPNLHKKSRITLGMDSLQEIEKKSKDIFELQLYNQDMFEKIAEEETVFAGIKPYKSKQYYINRFFLHPIYSYLFYAIKDAYEIQTIIVMRSCYAKESKCLRIVDVIGRIDSIAGVCNQLLELMEKNDYEYIDFMEAGIEKESLLLTGFKRRKDYPNLILPNYFEPFLQENIDLDYAYKTIDTETGLIFFKADADQDRPNLLPENF